MNVQRQIERLIVHRAAEWLEVLREGRTDEYPAFVRWISESPRHMDEFLKLLALSREANQAIRDSSFNCEELLARISPRVVPLPSTALPERKAPPEKIARRYFWPVSMVAASLVAILLMSFWLLQWKDISTAPGELHSVALADGSEVSLSARSHVQVRLRPWARDIRLIEGEALFRVAHDATRPFRVRTRDAVVQAVGTEFDVAARRAGTQVAVLEGNVRVSGRTASAAIATPLAAGEAVRVSSRGIERRPPEVALQATAWQQRRLVFEGASLEEAVDEFNRYHRDIQLHLEDVTPESHHYSGTFDADDVQSFADLLSREDDLMVDRRENEIVIRARQR